MKGTGKTNAYLLKTHTDEYLCLNPGHAHHLMELLSKNATHL